MKVRKSVKECQPGEKPKVVKTHYRNMIIGTTFIQFYSNFKSLRWSDHKSEFIQAKASQLLKLNLIWSELILLNTLSLTSQLDMEDQEWVQLRDLAIKIRSDIVVLLLTCWYIFFENSWNEKLGNSLYFIFNSIKT